MQVGHTFGCSGIVPTMDYVPGFDSMVGFRYHQTRYWKDVLQIKAFIKATMMMSKSAKYTKIPPSFTLKVP